MGPPPFGDGDCGSGDRRAQVRWASMGPPPFGDGKDVERIGADVVLGAASMGPPPFGDGDGTNSWLLATEDAGLQWGHRLSAMEITGQAGQCADFQKASMGPPPFGDGDTGRGTGADQGPEASMGPPPFGDGDVLEFLEWCQELKVLQWGHRLSAMEILLCSPSHCPSPPASMGPPPFGDGDDGIDSKPCLVQAASMGPPPFGDGDNTGADYERTRVWLLQWGHRLSAMEITPGPLPPPACPPCFNGATAFRRWRSGRVLEPAQEQACFNGATAFRRWR